MMGHNIVSVDKIMGSAGSPEFFEWIGIFTEISP
jgi:hypothetical protein